MKVSRKGIKPIQEEKKEKVELVSPLFDHTSSSFLLFNTLGRFHKIKSYE